MRAADDATRRGWRLGPFRPWEVVIIAIAVVLFAAAALAGPSTPPAGAPVATPSSSAPPVAQTPTAAPSPVAAVDQIIAAQVGDYELVDRRPPDEGPQGGAVQAIELRYEQTPRDPDTDVFHAIEIHLDDAAAEGRVRTFANAMSESGFQVVREQPLRATDGERQGYFIGLQSGSQSLLLWSNQNVTFSLGGAGAADVDSFYDALPY